MDQIKEKILFIVFICILLTPIIAFAQTGLEYSKNGVIKENGDKGWQDDEYESYTFKLVQNQTFKVKLTTDSGLLIIFFMQGNGVKKLQSAIISTLFGTPAEDIDGMWFYGIFDNLNPFTIEYTANENITGTLMIATYDIENLSVMNFVLETNIEEYNYDVDEFFVIGISFALVFLIIGIPVYFSYRKNRYKKNLSQITQRSIEMDTSNTYNLNNNQNAFLSDKCPHCGKTGNSMAFCSGCGKPMNQN
jgi:hypothetical protein